MPETTYRALATYPGIAQIHGVHYTLAHGISPGTVIISCAPQENLPVIGGTFTLYYGPVGREQPLLVLPECRVNTSALQRTKQNLIWQIAILDRRWKWLAGNGKYGPLFGTYNIRLDDDTLDPLRALGAQDLANLCLQAMGEVGYDVSSVPNNVNPLTIWEGENPARALASLADLVGCRVIYTAIDSVLVAPIGSGAAMPLGQTVEASVTIKPPPRPDSLAVLCGKSRYQADLALEPVGLDVDGSWKPILQLSYTPTVDLGGGNLAIGWDRQVPNMFNDVSITPGPGPTAPIPRDLALATVWRAYRIKVPFNLPGWGSDLSKLPFSGNLAGKQVTDLRQVLPIEDEQAVTYVEPTAVVGGAPGVVRNQAAYVYGQYYSADLGGTNTAALTPYLKNFSINRELGIVMFGDAVTLLNADGTYAPAIIYLRCAVSVRDPATWAWDRLYVPLVYPEGYGTGPRVLRHEEMQFRCAPTGYDANGKPLALASNLPGLMAEASYYLAAADYEYQLTSPMTAQYAGLIVVSPDGAIQQVTWSFGAQELPTTRVSRDNEVSTTHPPYRERRLYEQWHGGEIRMMKEQMLKLTNAKPTKVNGAMPGGPLIIV